MEIPVSKMLEEIDRSAFKKDITRVETTDKDIASIEGKIIGAIMSFSKGRIHSMELCGIKGKIMGALMRFANIRIPDTELCCINVIIDYGNDDGDQLTRFFELNLLYKKSDDILEEDARHKASWFAREIERNSDNENMRSYKDAQKIIVSIFPYNQEAKRKFEL